MNHPPLGNAADLTNLARALLTTKTASDALALSESARFDRASRILRAVVNGGSLADAGDFTAAVSGFIESLRTDFVFDTLLAGGMLRLPMKTRAIVTTIGAVGDVVSELGYKAVSNLDLSPADLTPFKVAVIVILSEELARVLATAGGDPMLTAELRGGVGGVTDRKFVTAIMEGVPEVAATGDGSALAIYSNLSALQALVRTGAQSRLYFVMSPTLAGALSLKTDSAGSPAFPMLGPQGGEIGNTPVLVTDALESASNGESVLLIDASGIAGDGGTVVLQRATQTSIQFDDQPASGAAAVWRSLWQQNQTALRAERFFSFKRLRADCVAELRGLEVAS